MELKEVLVKIVKGEMRINRNPFNGIESGFKGPQTPLPSFNSESIQWN
jgi:hypothetical protein